jgi:hypothetical protein
MNKRAEVQEIDNNVMPIKKHRWFGDVLVAQSRDDNGWAVFWPDSGRSESASSYKAAVKRAKGQANPMHRKRKNPTRRKNAGSNSKLLKNFTGVVRLNADKTVSIVGTGKKTNPARRGNSGVKGLQVSANWAQASDPIWYRIGTDDSWEVTPFQVASAQHSAKKAKLMVSKWLKYQSG